MCTSIIQSKISVVQSVACQQGKTREKQTGQTGFLDINNIVSAQSNDCDEPVDCKVRNLNDFFLFNLSSIIKDNVV